MRQREVHINDSDRETKPHNTGIRFGDMFKKYVESFPGKGFNQKLESMVLWLLKREDDILDKIAQLERDFKRRSAELDAIIQKKQAQIKELGDRENALVRANNDLVRVAELFENIKKNIEPLATPTNIDDIELSNK